MRINSLLLFESRFPALALMIRCPDNCLDSAPYVEIPRHFGSHRIARLDYVVENLIRDVLVECADAAVRKHVELERFKLDAQSVGYVFDIDGSEVRLTGFGTHAREFGTCDVDLVFPSGVLIIEGLELLRRGLFHLVLF